MLKLHAFLSVALWFLAATSHAKILNLQDAPFSAAGDGVTDDRGALSRAFAEARAGDVVLVPPGSYSVVLTGGALAIPEGITLLGVSGKSRFLLGSNGKSGEYREFLRPKSNVTIESLTIERHTDFSGVLFPITGEASNIALRNCRIDGQQSQFPKPKIHALRVGSGTVQKLTLDGVTIADCCYGLFQPNDATGTLDGVLVEHCRFERNLSSDLEFNSPRGVMRHIVVRDCFFRDNASTGASGGFAVGFANVAGGRVESCVIQNYGSEALHVEDRSSDIQLVGNTITGGSLRQSNGVILVVNDAKRVRIEGNTIDARSNTNKPHLILVTAGGKTFPNPSEVTVTKNILVNGPATRSWYLQKGSTAEPTGNLVFPDPAKPPAP